MRQHQWMRKKNFRISKTSQLQYLEKVIQSMFRLLEYCRNSTDDEICCLLFHPRMLWTEYQSIKRNDDDNRKSPIAPIRTAFRRFMDMAGTQNLILPELFLVAYVLGGLVQTAMGSNVTERRAWGQCHIA
jgi:hypothetical protein